MQKIWNICACICVSFILAFSSLAAHKKEPEPDYIDTIAQKILDCTQESEKLLAGVNKNKYRISIYQNISGIFIIVIPYSMTWVIDAYFPEAKWIKDALHYTVTPLTQVTAIPMLYHNFSQAATNLLLAETLLNESFRFFQDLGQVCKYLKEVLSHYKGDDIINVVEDYLNQLREDQTPVGNYIFSVLQKLQKQHTIQFEI